MYMLTVLVFIHGVLSDTEGNSDLRRQLLLSRSVGHSSEISRNFMIDIYERLTLGDSLAIASGHRRKTLGLSLSDTVRSIESKDAMARRGRQTIHFRIHGLVRQEKVHQAEIRIPTEQLQTTTTGKGMELEIRKHNSVLRKVVIRHKPFIDGKNSVWDITNLITPWVNGYHGNITVKLSYSLAGNISPILKRRSTIRKKMKSQKSKAILVLFSKDASFINELQKEYRKAVQKSKVKVSTKHLRHKRETKQLSNRTNRRRRKSCQVRDFEVDFNIIGWGQWILHPKRFNAKVCKGICSSPVKEYLTPTNHAMLQGLMRAGTKGRKNRVSMPCCVPTKLKPQSMLYYENDEIVVRHHEDMIVEECGCR